MFNSDKDIFEILRTPKYKSFCVIGIGIVMFSQGLTFENMNWEGDMFYSVYTGPIIAIIGVIMYIKARKNEKRNDT